MDGRLLVCATPIGNLSDVTRRVVDALRSANAIAAEDTRVTRKLLARYDIHTPLERYDEHTAAQRTPILIERIAGGETIALVSDAGPPGISDPGSLLVDAALTGSLTVEVLPGPSAIITALVASGLPTSAFYFGGFLPRKDGAARKVLSELRHLDATLIFYESPHRTAATLSRMAEELPDRVGAMARELTKVHEEVVRGTLDEVAANVADRRLKGEVVLLAGPPTPKEAPDVDVEDIRTRIGVKLAEGVSMRDAVRLVADEADLPRNLVYEAAHADQD